MGDLDGDGTAEVVTWTPNDHRLAVWRPTAKRELAQLAVHELDTTPLAVAVTDIDGDGAAELVVATPASPIPDGSDSSITVQLRSYHPLGKSGWIPADLARLRAAPIQPIVHPLPALGGEGRAGLWLAYAATSDCIALATLRHAGQAWTVEPEQYARGGWSAVAGDFYGIDRTVLAVGRRSGTRARSWPAVVTDTGRAPCAEDRVGGWALVINSGRRDTLPIAHAVATVAVGDVDGDQRLDLVFGSDREDGTADSASGAAVTIARWTGTGWTAQQLERIPTARRVRQLLLADLDGDGTDEILVTTEGRDGGDGPARLYRHARAGWQVAPLAEALPAVALITVPKKGGGWFGALRGVLGGAAHVATSGRANVSIGEKKQANAKQKSGDPALVVADTLPRLVSLEPGSLEWAKLGGAASPAGAH